MKTVQHLLFVIVCVLGLNTLSAQSDNTIVYVNKGLLGDERIKVVFANEDRTMCEATLYWLDILDEDYVKMKIKSCSETSNGGYSLKLADQNGKIYQAQYSFSTGFVLKYENGAEYVFGGEVVIKSGDNKFTLIAAGNNSYFAFTVPKQGLNEETFVLPSKADGKKFNEELMNFIYGDGNSMEFVIEPELNLDDVTAKIKMTRPDDETLVIEFTYKGKSTFFTHKG